MPLLRRHLIAGLAVALSLAAPAAAQNLRITGSGASFPFPLYAAWFQAYNARTTGARIDYQSTGSEAGIQAFIDRTVDFAGSDALMTDDQKARVPGGVIILPATAGKVVLAFNLPGITELNLPRDVYPAIFTGEITAWNDPRIVAANPGVTLPDRTIMVVRRSDGAGTTFIFTNHLAAISQTFAERIGAGTTVAWPDLPNFIAAPRNDGVMAMTMKTPGAIGFVEFGFAQRSGTPMAALQNAAGRFVRPTDEAGTLALSSGDFSGDGMQVFVADPADPGAYPITSMTWLVFHRNHGDPQVQAALRDFMVWAMDEGQAMAGELDYVPLPDVVKERVLARIALIR